MNDNSKEDSNLNPPNNALKRPMNPNTIHLRKDDNQDPINYGSEE